MAGRHYSLAGRQYITLAALALALSHTPAAGGIDKKVYLTDSVRQANVVQQTDSARAATRLTQLHHANLETAAALGGAYLGSIIFRDDLADLTGYGRMRIGDHAGVDLARQTFKVYTITGTVRQKGVSLTICGLTLRLGQDIGIQYTLHEHP